MAPLQVALVTWTFDLGGTEKTLLNHARAFDPQRVRARAVAVGPPGRRDVEFEALGIPVSHANGDGERLAELLRGADLVHAARNGLAEPTVPAARRAAGVPVLIETNVFGNFDTSPDEREFDCHLFMSLMCAMRYRRAVRVDHTAFHARHRVLYTPIDVDRLRSLAPSKRDAREALGLDLERPVVGRIGRADDRKWSPIVIRMLPALFELVPDAQVLLVGSTPAIRRELRRAGVAGRVVEIEPTADEQRLVAMYAACDVLASASSIGESFGVAIAEALALGVPVVTASTPWTDNAQVEVVEHGRTGYVANHPRPFAEAVARLLGDHELRERFAAEARRRADERFAARMVTERLEDLYEALVRTGRAPDVWSPGADDLAAFEAGYPERAATQFRPLGPRERAEARGAVLAERAKWFLRDAREDPVSRLRIVPAMLQARFKRVA